MAKQFLNINGLTTFLNKLIEIFATEAEVQQVENDTDTYVLNIDYSQIQFDTSQIISNNGTSSLLDVGLLDMMILE